MSSRNVSIRTRIRRVGSSLGVIIPKHELDQRRLKEGDEVEIPHIHKPAPRDLFGVWRDRPAKPGEAWP